MRAWLGGLVQAWFCSSFVNVYDAIALYIYVFVFLKARVIADELVLTTEGHLLFPEEFGDGLRKRRADLGQHLQSVVPAIFKAVASSHRLVYQSSTPGLPPESILQGGGPIFLKNNY